MVFTLMLSALSLMRLAPTILGLLAHAAVILLKTYFGCLVMAFSISEKIKIFVQNKYIQLPVCHMQRLVSLIKRIVGT